MTLRISFQVLASASVSFEVEGSEWRSLDTDAQETVIRHYAKMASEFDLSSESDSGHLHISAMTLPLKNIDPETIDVYEV